MRFVLPAVELRTVVYDVRPRHKIFRERSGIYGSGFCVVAEFLGVAELGNLRLHDPWHIDEGVYLLLVSLLPKSSDSAPIS